MDQDLGGRQLRLDGVAQPVGNLVGALLAGGVTSCAFLAILRFYQITQAAADTARFGGLNQDLIWNAFARRVSWNAIST